MTRAQAIFLGALALFAAVPLVVPDFYVTLLNYIGLYSIVALGLVLLTGVAGLTSLGHAAFVGFGAYTSAVLTTTYGFSPWLALPAALALTGLAAFLIGYLTLRLSGHYLALATIAWGISLFYIFGNIEGLGGFNGITGIPALSLFGVALESARAYYYFIWAIALAVLLSTVWLLDSRPGRAIRALRSPVMAEAMGVSTAGLKIVVFVYSAVLAGLAGWLHAHYLRFINPGPFGVNQSIEYLFMIVVGGAGQVWGAVTGAAVITLLKTWLQDALPKLIGGSGQYEIIVFGLLIVVLLQHAVGGVVPMLARLVPARPRSGVPAKAAALRIRERPPAGEILLEVEAAEKRFGGLVAVNGVSFALRSGEILGLIGPNGAGKTTMFNLITGVAPPSAGRVRFRSERIDALPARVSMRRGIARTFQHVRLRRGMSVLENVALGAHARGRTGILRAALRLDRREEAALLREAALQLARVGLGGRIHEAAGSLSLGEQRLVEIARALAADPVLLLLDEPAAGLRFHEKQALAVLLRDLRRSGTSILVIEHDMDFVMGLVDRLVVMDFGEMIGEGAPVAVQRDPKVIEAYLGT